MCYKQHAAVGGGSGINQVFRMGVECNVLQALNIQTLNPDRQMQCICNRLLGCYKGSNLFGA